MAASDYLVTGSGVICPRVRLGTSVTPGTTVFTLDDPYELMVNPQAGMAVMIDDEIVRVVSSTSDTITVARGCADTIPSVHSVGATMWFIDDAVGTDSREYLMGDTLGVKVLMNSTTVEMGVNDSPPNQIAMVGRAARPYPPAQVKVDGQPWFDVVPALGSDEPTMVITWVHRNRVTQSDQLLGHEDGGVTPEDGTTYTIGVHKADNTLVRSITGITGTTRSYTRGEAILDMAAASTPGVPVPGYLTLSSVRDGLASYQSYRIDFTVTSSGWGTNWGASWGTD